MEPESQRLITAPRRRTPRCLLVASSLLPRCFQDQPSKLEFRTRWLRLPAATPCGQETQLGKGSAGTSPFVRKSFASLASAQVECDPPRELTRPADVSARKNTQVVKQVEPVGEIVDAELQRHGVRGFLQQFVPGRHIEQGPRLDASPVEIQLRRDAGIDFTTAGVARVDLGGHTAIEPAGKRGPGSRLARVGHAELAFVALVLVAGKLQIRRELIA